MATVNVVKGSPDEAILRAQYGDNINYNYTNENQFRGADRIKTNQMYQEELSRAGIKAADAGDLWSFGGTPVQQNRYNAPAPKDYTSMINEQSDQSLQGTLAAIKAAVQKAIGQQQAIIKQAPEQYHNLKNIAYNQSLQQLPGMRENVANMGSSTESGYSRTLETRANSELFNRLGELDRQKQSVIDQANQAIESLKAQGDLDAANATAAAATSKLQAIVQESQRLDQIAQQNYWNSVNYATQEDQFNANQANWLKEFNANQAQQQWENAFNEKQFAASMARSSGGGGGYGGGSGSSGSGKITKNEATAEAYNTINAWIKGGYNYSQIRQAILGNAGQFAQYGLDPDKLADAAYGMLQSYRANSGGHFTM